MQPNLPKAGDAPETSRRFNQPGVYEHTAAGAKVEARQSAIADGLVRVGYVRVADLPTAEERKPKRFEQPEAPATNEAKVTKKGSK